MVKYKGGSNIGCYLANGHIDSLHIAQSCLGAMWTQAWTIFYTLKPHTHTFSLVPVCPAANRAAAHAPPAMFKLALPSPPTSCGGEVKASQVQAKLPEMCNTPEHIRIKINRTVNTFTLMTAQGHKEILHFIFSVWVRNLNAVYVDWTSFSLVCPCPTGLLLQAQIISNC